jgi:hypothetical protein
MHNSNFIIKIEQPKDSNSQDLVASATASTLSLHLRILERNNHSE